MRKGGLTLVELAVALALSAVLVTAALAAAAQMAKGQRQAQPAQADDQAVARMKDLISLDLLHGQSWRPTKEGLAIQTWTCLDGRTRAMSHRPVTVTYEVRRVGDQSWLWRRQQGREKADDLIDLVSGGVDRAALQVRSRPTGPASDWRALPDEVTVELSGVNGCRWTVWRQ